MRFALFAPVVLLVYGVMSWLGWPHPIWSYEYLAVDTHPMTKRQYISCTFVGPYGEWTEAAREGRCVWVRWRRADEVS